MQVLESLCSVDYMGQAKRVQERTRNTVLTRIHGKCNLMYARCVERIQWNIHEGRMRGGILRETDTESIQLGFKENNNNNNSNKDTGTQGAKERRGKSPSKVVKDRDRT